MLTACRTRKENVDNQRIVDEFLFGKSIQVGYLIDVLPSADTNLPYGVSYKTNTKELILKIKNKLYKFQVVKNIGEGAFGSVWLYYDNNNQVSLAIKETKDEKELIISNALLKSSCDVLKVRGLKKHIYIMEQAEGDMYSFMKKLKKPVSIKFIFNIVEQVRRQILCIGNLHPSFMYSDVKLKNILYKCHNPNNLNDIRVFLGDLASAIPRYHNGMPIYDTTYLPLPQNNFTIRNNQEKLNWISWQIGALLLESSIFLFKDIDKIIFIDKLIHKMHWSNIIKLQPSQIYSLIEELKNTIDSTYGNGFSGYFSISSRTDPNIPLIKTNLVFTDFEILSFEKPPPQPQAQYRPPPPPQPQYRPPPPPQPQYRPPPPPQPQYRPPPQPQYRPPQPQYRPPPQPQPQYRPPPPPQYRPPPPQFNKLSKKQLESLTVVQLKEQAKKLRCSGYSNLRKKELVNLVFKCMN